MKTIQETVNEFDFENEFDFFNYIIESYINGQKKQFNALMYEFSQASLYFELQDLQICILNACNVFGLENTIKILKSYKYNYDSISDNLIINAFHDNSRSELNEVKTILLNLNDY